MSSDFERLLRDAREALPMPDEPSTQRARGRAVASLRRRRRRTRALVLVGAMLVSAVALGVTAGSLNAPSVTAAREPAVLGFVPEPGWFALQSPPPAIEGQQSVAVAANVPFAADDVDDGLVEPSGLPYSTLLTLPPDGIVIVSTMTTQALPHVAPVQTSPDYPRVDLPLRLRDALPVLRWGAQVRPDQPMAQYHMRGHLHGHDVAPVQTSPDYPRVDLPLRLRDALPVLRWGAQVRPDQPMAQYHMRGHLHGYDVDVIVYFGTPRPTEELLGEAQRQLDGFVVRPERVDATSRPAAVATPSGTVAVIDRTFECSTVLLGGLYQVEVRAHAGDRLSGQWARLPYAGVSTGGNAGRPDASVPPVSTLAWISAGSPAPQTTVDDAYDAFVVQTGGTLGRSTDLCRPSSARVELSRAGLRGGGVRSEVSSFDCSTQKRVLIRIRATALGSAALRERGRIFVATGTTLSRAELAVRTPNGKLLAYASVDQSGRSRQFTASRGCVREP